MTGSTPTPPSSPPAPAAAGVIAARVPVRIGLGAPSRIGLRAGSPLAPRPAAGSSGSAAVVLGGGLAGIAAAVRLADAGWRVTLVERGRHLGGRASSHVDPRGGGGGGGDDGVPGRLLDNCQHVLLGCCTNVVDLYRRLGVDGLVDWHARLHFLDRSGRHDVLCRGRLPAPFHLAPSLARFRTLGWGAKLAIAAAIASMLRPSPDDVDEGEYDGSASDERGGSVRGDRTFAGWLRRRRQPLEAVDRFWNLVVTGALNETSDRVGVAAALGVFRRAFLGHRDGYLVGVPRVPLAELHGAAAAYLARRGGRVLTGTAVRALSFDDGAAAVTGADLRCGGRLTADAYVSALPHDALHRAAPAALRAADERLSRLTEFRASPILGVHLWFDRPVTDLPHAVFVDSSLHWVFNRGADPLDGRQHLHVVVSAARAWVDVPADEILRRVRLELAAYFPAVAAAAVVDARVIKERRATFSPAPGVDAIRPVAAGAVRNLFLAGDWCRTGWPATMEGAARSGYLAAAAVLGRPCLVPDLPAAWPVPRTEFDPAGPAAAAGGAAAWGAAASGQLAADRLSNTRSAT